MLVTCITKLLMHCVCVVCVCMRVCTNVCYSDANIVYIKVQPHVTLPHASIQTC